MSEFQQFYKELNANDQPRNPEEFREHFNAYLIDMIKTKENFMEIIEQYSIGEKKIWLRQEAQNCDCLSPRDIKKALRCGTYESGEKSCLQCEDMVMKWAFHLSDYATTVSDNESSDILELATGAGLGTYAVMKHLLPNSRLISVDVDFAAAKNADGLARYLHVSDRACGLNANMWFLPFEDEAFDTVCTHYGLDESREIQAVLKEAARVLKNNGRFVVVARKNPFDRQKSIMSLFDISECECNRLLKKARLYSGFDDLVELAQTNGLTLIEHRVYEPEASHHRVLCVFQKQTSHQSSSVLTHSPPTST